MNFIYFICLGALAGWLGGKIMRGAGFGLAGDIIVGIIGGVIGGWVFRQLGLYSYTFFGSLVTAVVGAMILIGLVRLIKSI